MSLCSAVQKTQDSSVLVYKMRSSGKKKHEDLTSFWLREVRPLERESCISKNVQNDQVQHRICLKNDLL